MDQIHEKFLILLRASLTGRCAGELADTTPEQWQKICALANAHHVLPMVYEAAGRTPALTALRHQVLQQIFLQVQRTNDFLRLYRHLRQKGIAPLVTKGIICRSLYPQPDHRPSGDEDLLIPAEQFDACHAALTEFGMAVPSISNCTNSFSPRMRRPTATGIGSSTAVSGEVWRWRFPAFRCGPCARRIISSI